MAIFTVSGGGVPAGSYTGTFAGVEATPPDPAKGYGPGVRFRFTIDSGPCAGQSASRVTGNTASPKNACGKILSGLIGRTLKEGEQVDPDLFVGRRYMLVVAAGQNGGTRVEAVVPVPAG